MSIDFVITWVDNNDENWINEYNKYSKKPIEKHRYRDWGFLKYWFRSVERNAPWVNKIFFVTCGHIPDWLDTNNEKLIVVKHSDFIDKKYLPTFNSCVIESNFHKIKGLSEYFVYFNDDMFLNDYTSEYDFYKNNLPCDTAILSRIWARGINSTFINYNCSNVVNKYYKISDLKKLDNVIIRKDIKNILKKLLFFNKKNMLCLIPQHVPTSYLKSTFLSVWNNENKLLSEMNNHKFRTNEDVSQWVFQFWQIASQNYTHRDINFSKYYQIKTETLNESINEIESRKYKLICLNDGENTSDYEENKGKLINMFDRMYNKKSKFEK